MSIDEIMRDAARDLAAEVRAGVDASAALARVEAAGGRRRGTRGPWLLVAAVVLVVLGLGAAVLVALDDDDRQPVISGGPELTTTTMDGPLPGESVGLETVVTPSVDLGDGDEVRVTTEGLPAEPGQVELMMCTGDAMERAPGTERCESAPLVEPITPTDGRIDTTFAVEQIVNLGAEGRVVDCAAAGARCAIGITINRPIDPARPSDGGPELVGLVGVAFAPVESLGEPRLRVSPSEGLDHGQVVTLTGEGFVGSVAEANLCAPQSAGGSRACAPVSLVGDDDPVGELPTDERGRFTVDVQVWRSLTMSAEIVDCAEVECALELVGEDGTVAPPVRLGFDATTPTPQPPTLEVSPTTGLHPGDPVTITVRGLTPGVEAFLSACTLGGAVSPGGCGQSTSLEPVVGEEDDEVTLTLPAIDPLQYGQTCTEPGLCAVSLGEMSGPSDPLLSAVTPVPVQYAP